MEPPPELEIIDPRHGRERDFARIVLFILPAPIVTAVVVALVNGRLAEVGFSIVLFSVLIGSLGSVIYYSVFYWAIIGVDQDGLTAVSYEGEIRVPFTKIAKLDWSYVGNVVLWTDDRRKLQPGATLIVSSESGSITNCVFTSPGRNNGIGQRFAAGTSSGATSGNAVVMSRQPMNFG